MKTTKKLVGVIVVVVALLISATAVFAEEPEVFKYYDADNDRDCVEYYYGDTAGELYDTFSYYDADNDTYVTEYYYSDDSDGDDCGWYPDYSDLYYDEYQAAYYSSVSLNDWADFYSLDGEYICTIPEGTWVQPMESIGRSGDITYIMYNGYQGYVYTALLLHPPYVVCCEPTYDEIYQTGDVYVVQLLTAANLRDENGNILATIPAGYAVEFINYDETIDRCWVRWNGLFGSIISTAIWSGSDFDCYYDDGYEECYDEGFGYARIKPSIGANVRDCDNKIITAVPCGEEVMLLEPINYGGRTLIKWGRYTGTVLTSCLKDYSA
jgi:hypothetical protein